MSESNFSPIGTYIDNDKIEGSEWTFNGSDLLIPVSKIKAGESLSLLYPNTGTGLSTNATLLSLNNKNIYKNIDIEAEIEFSDILSSQPQTFEIITRAINKYDKRFSADEYYAMGYRNGSFYFTRYAYFLENGKSLVYSVLYNLGLNDQIRYFLDFTQEQKDELYIGDKLDYNKKYTFKFSIVDNYISLSIKRRGLVASQGANYNWVSILDNLDISNNETSVRNSTLDKVISVPVSISNIDNKGFFGINVPNSHLKLHRIKVSPLDDSSSIRLFDDIEYSRKIATEFNFVFKNTERILLNSVNGIKEDDSNVLELHSTDKIQLDKRNVSNITKNDITKIQFNNYELNNTQYVNKFINVTTSSLEKFNGSSLYAYIGEEKSLYGQYESYLTPISINNTNTFSFSAIDFSKLKNSPNIIISDVLVELPSTIVYDESSSFTNNEVGIKEQDTLNFITKEEVLSRYKGKRFYLECTFRGNRRTFDMGYIEEGRTTFSIDKEFLRVSPSYDAIWKYHISYWIDKLASEISVTGLSDTTTFGYSLLSKDLYIIEYVDSMISEAYNVTHTNYPIISDYFSGMILYAKENDVFVSELEEIARALIYFNQGGYKELILDVIKRDTTFNSSFIEINDQVPFINDVSYHTQFISFRNSWLLQAEKYRELSLENRIYYISLTEDEYNLDLVNNKLSITGNTQYNDKNVRLRIWNDNNILLSSTYDSSDKYYDVDQTIKDLYEDSSETIYPDELYGVLDSDKIKTIKNGSITYVVVPNLYLGNNTDRQLFADVEILSPFPEESEKVKRNIKVPLVNVQDLLDFEFSDTRTGSIFTSGGDISGSTNRQLDNVDISLEANHSTGYKKIYTNPTNTVSTVTVYNAPIISGGELDGITVTNKEELAVYLEEEDINLTVEQWIYSEIERVGFWNAINSELLYPYALSDKFLDEILDVGNWFNINDTKLGEYYREVISNIIETKNKNKVKGERLLFDDPFELDSWLDGFYTGTISFIPTGLQVTTATQTPWGDQNSRYQLLEQIKNTLRFENEPKFQNYSLFFVDLSNIVTNNNLGFGSNFIDSTIYPVGINEEFIHNPFVNSIALSGYSQNGSYDMTTLVKTISGNVISDETDFSFIPRDTEFKEENKDSYTNLGNLSFDIKNVMFSINNNEDIFWGFNDSILLKDLPSGINVNIEFEYNKVGYIDPIFSKINIGKTSGSGEDLFPYPNKKYIANATKVKVNRIWLDNYEVTNYNIQNIDDNLFQIVFNDIVFNNKPNISMKYRTDKLSDPKYKNIFLDDFNKKRQMKWTSLTKDKFGYSRIPNTYVGFIKDVKDGVSIFRKGDMNKVNGEYEVKTGGTTTGRVKVKGLGIGRDNENIIAISNIERKNNFEMKTTILFDNEVERGMMKTSFIFRGKFNLIDNSQYLSDYYEVVLNLDDSTVTLIQKYYEGTEVKSNILAKIIESNNIIKRGVEYNLTFSVIQDIFKVYLNKNNEKKQFLFEYDLQNGPSNEKLFNNVSELQGSLGVEFHKPKNFNSTGTKIGFTTITDKVYFSNIKITAFVPNNLTFSDTFLSNSLDGDIMALKSTYKINGNVRQIAKTDDNITIVLIGTSLFSKRGDDSGWVKLGRRVKDFRVQGVYIYVNELLSNLNTILNVYRGLFELQESILTDSDSLVGSVRDDNKVINKINKFGDTIVLDITDEHTYEDISWKEEDKMSWGDDHILWDTFDL